MALKAYLKDDSLDVILEQPNNILGIEYIKALYKKKAASRLIPSNAWYPATTMRN